MTNREKFEAWLCSEYQWANDALNIAHFQGDDATGYYTGGDFIYDGQSCHDALFWAWRGWQANKGDAAARTTIVKLPTLNPKMFNDDVMFGYRKAQREAVEICDAAGISLKIEGD